MKVNVFSAILAVVLAFLLGLLVYEVSTPHHNAKVIAITTGVALAVTLVSAMALKHENARVGVNIRIISSIFSFIIIAVAAIVCFIKLENLILFFIFIGIILLIFLAIMHSLIKIKDV